MDYNEIFENLRVTTPVINLGAIFKIPLILFLLGGLFYAFMLILKIRILVDTIESTGNSRMRILVYVNFLASIIGGVLGVVLILLG